MKKFKKEKKGAKYNYTFHDDAGFVLYNITTTQDLKAIVWHETGLLSQYVVKEDYEGDNEVKDKVNNGKAILTEE